MNIIRIKIKREYCKYPDVVESFSPSDNHLINSYKMEFYDVNNYNEEISADEVIKMLTFPGYEDSEGSTCCFGSFDGFHKGHMELITQAFRHSKFFVKVGVCFFDVPFNAVFNKYDNRKSVFSNSIIMSVEDKIELLRHKDISYVLIIELSNDVISMDKDTFIKLFILNLKIKNVVIGEDYTFGKNREGTSSYLSQRGTESGLFNVVVCKLVRDGESSDPSEDGSDTPSSSSMKVSSTAIRELIHSGQIEEANKLLGREYSIRGKVIHGYNNGEKLSFPTANLQLKDNYLVPSNGVYITTTEIDSNIYFSMTNIGTHPTIDELSFPVIETHILGYDNTIYNKEMKLTFFSKLREERKFDSIEELKQQLSRDRCEVIFYFNKRKMKGSW